MMAPAAPPPPVAQAPPKKQQINLGLLLQRNDQELSRWVETLCVCSLCIFLYTRDALGSE